MRTSNAARWRGPGEAEQTKLTPAYILEPVREALGGIDLDPCSLAHNPTRATRWCYLPDRDGLAEEWRGSVWVNPPYGNARKPFVVRALAAGQAGARVALLIAADTETALVQSVLTGCDAVLFVAGRVDFGTYREGDPNKPWTATHPSLIAWWNADPPDGLGVVMRPRAVRGLLENVA